MESSPFMTRMSQFSRDLDLRMDEKFIRKVSKSGFNIVEDSVYTFRELSEFLSISKERFVYEPGRVHPGVSTDHKHFSEDGEVVEFEEASLENHPIRLEMAVRPDDIIISKLKGARSPVILATREHAEYAWSNGFLILRQKNRRLYARFLYYVLRSSFFKEIIDGNLSRGIGISAFYPRDLLRLRIPEVPLDVQEEVVREAEEIKSKIALARDSMPDIPMLIDQVFKEEMGCRKNENFNAKQNQASVVSFSDLGRKKSLRCDVKYSRFFKETNGNVFCGCENSVQLRQALEPFVLPLVPKGNLRENMVLIEKEDILPKTGSIVNEEYVSRVDSDKVDFGDSDLLVSRIDPFLGHIIQNNRDKPLIGTTEFLGFKIREGNNIDYLQYAMLSDAFLESTRSLVTGKRQPRISSYDLLNIGIPLPSKERQAEISRKISARIGDLRSKMKTVESLEEEIDVKIRAALVGK